MGAILLGGIVHLMIFQNGYWNDMFWLSAILTVGGPIVIHKYLNMGKRKKRVTRLTTQEI